MTGNGTPWWQSAIIYQVYPLSFYDTNDDGIGDLPGIGRKLDYLASLGINAIWLNPIYASPLVDHGYDITDHTAVNPTLGSMADFEQFLAAVHERGMKLILDFVPNHTSDQHPWFLESRSSRDNPRREWYLWRDPGHGGGPPNNWIGYFGPSWTYDQGTGQYYLRLHPTMPELNHRNPVVVQAMLDVLRHWLDKGVDGFRIDIISQFIKHAEFLDEPPNPHYQPDQHPYYSLQRLYTRDQPEIHDIVKAMRATLDGYHDRVMLGELDPTPALMSYYGTELDECHLPFNLNLLYVPWQAKAVRDAVVNYEAALPQGAWPNWILGNHDQPRIASRVGRQQARVAQMLLLTLRGTPICYYGDEIGMTDVSIPPERSRDPMGHTVDAQFSRDPERTPMQWTADPHAGFCPAETQPWLPVADDYPRTNVAAQDDDPRSMLNLFRALTRLRRTTTALTKGSLVVVDTANHNVFTYRRRHGDNVYAVALNFGTATEYVDLAAPRGDVLVSTRMDRSGTEDLTTLRLRPNEGLIAHLPQPPTTEN